MAVPKRPRQRRREKEKGEERLSLHPLSFREALSAALKTPKKNEYDRKDPEKES